MNTRLLTAVAALATITASPAIAQVPFAGGSGTFTNLGDDGRNSGFDRVTLTGLPGVFTGDGFYAIDDVLFETGFNRTTTGQFPGTFDLTGNFGGTPFNYTLNYRLDVNDDGDVLNILASTFNVQGTTVFVNPLTISALGIGTQPGVLSAGNGVLTVRVGDAVPEPATWAMMMVGFGMVGFGLRRRAASTVRVTYA